MYAIIKTGGKQYKVAPGDVLSVEKLDAEVGAEVRFDALMTVDGDAVVIGKPVVEGSDVVAKYKPKKDYKKTQGHRQPYTKIEIVSVK